MSTSVTDLQVVRPSQIAERRPSFAPTTIDEAFNFAEMLLESGMLPKSYVGKPPSSIVVALQFGMEVGLAPLQSLQNIANINGQPSMWGDAALALCKSYPNIFEYCIEQDFETIKAQKYALCRVKRRGEPEVVRTFSLDDATKAGIITNAVWKTYPQRMMQMRARAFALRDTFPDILKGLAIAEEVQDYQAIEPDSQPTQTTPTIAYQVKPEEQKAQVQAETAQAGTQPERGDLEALIEIEDAMKLRNTYMASGYDAQDAKAAFERLANGATNSKQIKRKYFAACMQWAVTPKGKVDNPDAEQTF